MRKVINWDAILGNPYWVSFCYCLVGLIVFGPFLFKNFSSDDFEIIYGLANHGILLKKGFFRPFSDLTLLLNYSFTGFKPFFYYFFNLSIHVFNSILIFGFCRKFYSDLIDVNRTLSFLSGMLFLIYPFHTEALFWVVGRGASLGAFFFLLSLNLVYCSASAYLKILGFFILYTLALSTYESTLFMPLLLSPFIWLVHRNRKLFVAFLGTMLLAFLINIFLRVSIANTLTGTYANYVIDLDTKAYLLHLFKYFTRLFTPPIQQLRWYLTLSFIGVFLIGTLWMIYYKKNNKENARRLSILIILLCVSVFLPALFSISTKTSESDRLIYLPSIFFVIILVDLIINGVAQARIKKVLFTIVFSCSLFYLGIGIVNWMKASRKVDAILTQLKSYVLKNKQLYVFNVPDAYEGAYIFRHGFYEALKMNQIDTSKIRLVNIADSKVTVFNPFYNSKGFVNTYYFADKIQLKRTGRVNFVALEIDEKLAAIIDLRSSCIIEWRDSTFQKIN